MSNQPTLSPFTVDKWIVATLLATAGATTKVNGQTVPADAVALVGNRIHPLRGDFSPTDDGWPYILYRPNKAPTIDSYGEAAVLADGMYVIYMVMCEDKLAAANWTGDLEDFTKQGAIAIQAAFAGVKDDAAGSDGIVHGCEIVQLWQRLYGQPGHFVSEMGVVAHIYST